MDLTPDNDMTPTLTNPFENTDDEATVSTDYQAAVARGEELQALPDQLQPIGIFCVNTAKIE